MSQNEEFKKKQKAKIDACVKGSKDSDGDEIVSVYHRGDEFVIYEVETEKLTDSIVVYILPSTEDDKNNVEENFWKIRMKYNEIKGYLYKVKDITTYKSRLAGVLALGISGQTQEANNQFEKLKDEINKVYSEQFKNTIRFLFSTLTTTLVAVIFSFITYQFDLFSERPYTVKFIFISTGALIGGFISVSSRIKDIVFEKEVKPNLYILYGLERSLVAIFFGSIVFFAIESNLLFGIVKDLKNPIFGLILFAVVGGFSETLVPNLLLNLEQPNETS